MRYVLDVTNESKRLGAAVTESLNTSLLPCLYCFPKTFPDDVNHQELHRATQEILRSHSFVQVSVETILSSEGGKGIYKAERKDS